MHSSAIAVQVESDVEVAEPLEEPAAVAEEAPAEAEASGSAPADAEVILVLVYRLLKELLHVMRTRAHKSFQQP